MNPVKRLTVTYEADTIDTKFDHELSQLLKAHGWIWYGAGYDLKKGIRDMAFERKANYEGS